MSDLETLTERVRTLERAVTDGDHTFPAMDEVAELTERLDELEQQVDTLDEQVAELEGATQALRGYVGNIRSVNERVEQRADTALAATERLERRMDEPVQPGEQRRARANDSAHTNGSGRNGTEPAESLERTPTPETHDSPEPPDIGTRATDGGDRAAGEQDDSDGTADTGVIERIRSLL